MISKKYTREMLRGRKARVLVDIANKGGCGVSAGGYSDNRKCCPR